MVGALIAGLIFCAHSRPAQAGGVERARELFSGGKQLMAKRQYVAALASFVEAAKLTDRASVRLNLAQCLRLLNLPPQALHYYRAYLRKARRSRQQARYAAEVAGHIRTLEQRVKVFERGFAQQQRSDHLAALITLAPLAEQGWPLAELAMARSYAALEREAKARVHARRARAVLQKLIQRWRRHGMGIEELPGGRELAAQASEAERFFSAGSDEQGGDQADERKGTLILEGLPPRAKVLVDGRSASGPDELFASGSSTTGRLAFDIEAGVHRVAVIADSERTWRRRVAVREGGTIVLTVRFATAARSNRWLVAAIATGAAAGISEILALVFLVKGNDQFTNDPDFDTFRNLTIAGHVTAAVMAAASGVSIYLHVRSRRDSSSRRRSGVSLGPTRGGAFVGGWMRF